MTYEAWSPLFLGMVLSMLLANSVQWFMYRERIYGIYSIYTLTWAIYFTINHFDQPYNIANFQKLILSYSGYILYLELAKIFLNLRERPKTIRVDSNGVGLSNIITKYRLLNQPQPLIEEHEGWFRVTLPLLMPHLDSSKQN